MPFINQTICVQPLRIKRFKHFMVAFFGYHLQGREDYRQYFSEEFVSQFEDLAWGMVK